MIRNRVVKLGDLPYDNTTSGLAADEVQAALDEIAAAVDALEGGAVDGGSLAASPDPAQVDGGTL